MVSKKQNPPPPKPVVEEDEEYSEEEVEEVEEVEEEVVEEVEEEDEEEDEDHQEKPQVEADSGDEAFSGDETDSNEDEDQSSITKKVQSSVSVAEDTESEGEEEVEEEEEDAELTNAEPDSIGSPSASEYTVRPITVPNNKKRPLEASKDDGKGSRNGKKAKNGEENDEKGKGATRVWNEENEIVVLQGLIDFQKRKGPFRPGLDLGVFYEYIKGKLWDGVTKNQISDKLKRAKRKYSENVKKGKNGQDPVFSKPHEKKSFDLSKQIWGPGSDSNGTVDKAKIKGDDGKGKKAVNSGSENNKKVEDDTKVKTDNLKRKKGDNAGSALIPSMDVDKNEKQDVKMLDLKDVEEIDFFSKFPTLSESFDADLGFLKEHVHLIGHQKAGELEEKWKQLQVEEMAMLSKRLRIQSEQIKMVLYAMEKQ